MNEYDRTFKTLPVLVTLFLMDMFTKDKVSVISIIYIEKLIRVIKETID